MVYVSMTCMKSTETCKADQSEFEAYGSAGVIYDPIYGIVGIADEIDGVEFLEGATVIRWIAFEVKEGETNFVLAFTPTVSLFSTSETFYLKLPESIESK